jgi:hypothetical protein
MPGLRLDTEQSTLAIRKNFWCQGMAQVVVEYLPSNRQALGSIPSITIKKILWRPLMVVHTYNPSTWGYLDAVLEKQNKRTPPLLAKSSLAPTRPHPVISPRANLCPACLQLPKG